MTSALGHHVRLHLAGSAAGIDLFGRAAAGTHDQQLASLLREILQELHAERDALRSMARSLDVQESRLLSLGARAGERVGRLKPNGSWTRRTPLTDLVELEMMRDLVAGKRAGWEALAAVADRYPVLDLEQLRGLVQQAHAQEDHLATAHRRAAERALAP